MTLIRLSKLKSLKNIRIILVLVFISLFFPITFVYTMVRDTPFLSSLFYDYIISGKSVLLPFIPDINIIWFIPEHDKITHFSYGHLIDLVIFVNVFAYIDSSIYHYIKWTSYSGGSLMFIYIDLYNQSSEKRLFDLFDDPELLGLDNESNTDLNYSTKKEDCGYNYHYYMKDDINQSKIIHRKHKFLSIDHLFKINILNFHPSFERSDISLSIICCHPSALNNYTCFNGFTLWEEVFSW